MSKVVPFNDSFSSELEPSSYRDAINQSMRVIEEEEETNILMMNLQDKC